QSTGEFAAERSGDIGQRLDPVVRAVANRDLAFGHELGELRIEIDDATERARAEQHRRGAAQDLHAVEVVRVGADARVIAEDVAHSVAELQSADTAYEAAVDAAVGPVGVGLDAGDVVQRVADRHGALGFKYLGRDYRDRLRHFDGRGVGLGRRAADEKVAGDDDPVHVGHVLFGQRGYGRHGR